MWDLLLLYPKRNLVSLRRKCKIGDLDGWVEVAWKWIAWETVLLLSGWCDQWLGWIRVVYVPVICISRLFQTSESMTHLITQEYLYQSLPIYPLLQDVRWRCVELRICTHENKSPKLCRGIQLPDGLVRILQLWHPGLAIALLGWTVVRTIYRTLTSCVRL